MNEKFTQDYLQGRVDMANETADHYRTSTHRNKRVALYCDEQEEMNKKRIARLPKGIATMSNREFSALHKKKITSVIWLTGFVASMLGGALCVSILMMTGNVTI